MAEDSVVHKIVAGICVLAVIGLVAGHVRRVAIQKELTDVTEQLDKATVTMKTMVPKEVAAQLRTKNHKLTSQLATTQAKLKKAETALAGMVTPVPTDLDSDVPLAAQVRNDGASGSGTTDGSVAEDQSKEKSPLAGFADMFKGKQGKKMMEFGVKAAVDMQYADFLNELNLDPDTESQVRQIIQTAMIDQMSKGMDSMDKAFDPEYKKEMEQTLTDRLKNDLSGVLDGNQMAIWEEYEATKQERLLTKQYDMQLGMFASGLTPENRTIAADVMVDETLAMQESRKNNPDAQHGLQAELDAQLQAFENARARLAQQFDDRQMAQIDRFIDQQKNSFKLVADMTKNMANDTSQPQPAESPVPAAENK